MPTPRRTTVHLDFDLHRALRLQATAKARTISERIDEAVRSALVEDAVDLDAFEVRAAEPSLPFRTVVRDLKRSKRF